MKRKRKRRQSLLFIQDEQMTMFTEHSLGRKREDRLIGNCERSTSMYFLRLLLLQRKRFAVDDMVRVLSEELFVTEACECLTTHTNNSCLCVLHATSCQKQALIH